MGLFDTPPPMLGKRFGCMDAEEVGARWGVQTAKIFGPLLKELKSADLTISLDTEANGVRTTRFTLGVKDQSDNRKAFTGSCSEGPDGIHGEWAATTVPSNKPAEEEEDPKPPGM